MSKSNKKYLPPRNLWSGICDVQTNELLYQAGLPNDGKVASVMGVSKKENTSFPLEHK